MRALAIALAAVLLPALGGCSGKVPGQSSGNADAGPAPAHACGPGAVGGSATVVTARHELTARVSGFVPLFSATQVAQRHPARGEVVHGRFDGQAAAGVPLAIGGVPRHLDLYVCDRASGRRSRGIAPLVTILGPGAARALPLVFLSAIGAGAGDLHYGTNVDLPVRGSLRLEVALAGERATLAVPVAQASSS